MTILLSFVFWLNQMYMYMYCFVLCWKCQTRVLRTFFTTYFCSYVGHTSRPFALWEWMMGWTITEMLCTPEGYDRVQYPFIPPTHRLTKRVVHVGDVIVSKTPAVWCEWRWANSIRERACRVLVLETDFYSVICLLDLLNWVLFSACVRM